MRIRPTVSVVGLVPGLIPALLLAASIPVAGGIRTGRHARVSAPEIAAALTTRALARAQEADLTRKPALAQTQGLPQTQAPSKRRDVPESQPVPKSQTESEVQTESETQPEKIFAGPKDIKERIAVYVFLGWLWLSIAVLIYLLRLKIREIDRLDDFSYFTADPRKPGE